MVLEKLRIWLIHELGGVTPEENVFSNKCAVAGQCTRMPVRLTSHVRVRTGFSETFERLYVKQMAGRIAETIVERDLYTVREYEPCPNSVDGHEVEMIVDILPPV